MAPAAVLVVDEDILGIIQASKIDETGLILRGHLDREQYASVNKVLELCG